MYTEHFGLAEEAFRITADPRFLWYSPQHKAAKSLIVYHIQTRRGPVYLYADVGMGKTSIAKRVREELQSNPAQKVVYLLAPNIKTSNAFLRLVMEAFDVKTDKNYARGLQNFERFLLAQYQAGISPVLLVDEAQNMTPDMLKLIHHLFNFSTDKEFLIQVALFGQNELRGRIKQHTSLDSRITPSQLKPFDLEGTKQLMEFRWQVAGGSVLPFTDEAILEVHKLSGGNPRRISRLCTAALFQATASQEHTITKDIVIMAVPLAFADDETART